MERFHPELETCPVCGQTGQCHVHAYYGRSIMDHSSGRNARENLCVMRVICNSCGHSHAILPDIIIPYSGYGLLFILQVLSVHFSHLRTNEQICEQFSISIAQLYKWIALWKTHKSIWLGVLSDAETSDTDFLAQLYETASYSRFSMNFVRKLARSFLQSHRNPVLKRWKPAHYKQVIFEPDIDLFQPHN